MPYNRSTTFTHNLRSALYDAGWRKGKPITFFLRMKNGKRKKVRGNFQYLSHVPNPISIWGRIHQNKNVQDTPKGFFIQLNHVHWLGHYWGPVTIGFPCSRIEWDERFEHIFASAREIARQKTPRLVAVMTRKRKR